MAKTPTSVSNPPVRQDRAAIFDMDGLLIDSEPLWRRAEIAVFRTVGVALDETLCLQTTGMRIDAAVNHWYERFSWQGKTPKEVERELLLQVQDEIVQSGVSMPGVLETLEIVRSARWRIGLASSSPLTLIESVVEKLAIADYFEVLCSSEDEQYGKPDPAVYLTAARRLGVPPANCVAFEDSLPGIRSAKAAGMKVVAVPEPALHNDEVARAADLLLQSLQSFTEETLALIDR